MQNHAVAASSTDARRQPAWRKCRPSVHLPHPFRAPLRVLDQGHRVPARVATTAGPAAELQRAAFLIYETQRVRAAVARVTTRLRHWCQLFHADEDAAAIVSIAAYGAHAAFVAPPPWIDAVPNSIRPHDTYATATDVFRGQVTVATLPWRGAQNAVHAAGSLLDPAQFLSQRLLCMEHGVLSTRLGRRSTIAVCVATPRFVACAVLNVDHVLTPSAFLDGSAVSLVPLNSHASNDGLIQ